MALRALLELRIGVSRRRQDRAMAGDMPRVQPLWLYTDRDSSKWQGG